MNYADDLVDGVVVAEEGDLRNYADDLVDGLFLAGLVDGGIAGEEDRQDDAVCLVEDFVSGEGDGRNDVKSLVDDVMMVEGDVSGFVGGVTVEGKNGDIKEAIDFSVDVYVEDKGSVDLYQDDHMKRVINVNSRLNPSWAKTIII